MTSNRLTFALSLVLALATTLAAAATPPKWTWEAGTQTNNGAITLKSTNGSTTYSGTQNPTGAVAKTNQNAATQPPTVIIQATGGSNFYDDPQTYMTTNCWLFPNPVSKANGEPNYQMVIGRGKINAGLFTGHIAYAGSWSGTYTPSLRYGGVAVYTGTLTNYVTSDSNGSPTGTFYRYCGADNTCAWNSAYAAPTYAYEPPYLVLSGPNTSSVTGVTNLPVTTPHSCTF